MIGLTGGIASGKSTVTKTLRELGAEVFDADMISREVISYPEVLERVRGEFGEGVFRVDGSLDRAALAGIVFASDENAAKLDAITHPAIINALLERSAAAEERGHIAFVDAALLIESGFSRYCDEVWLVTADLETRVLRIMERDGLCREAAENRIARQMTDAEKLPFADVVLENNGGPEELGKRVTEAYLRIKEKKYKDEIGKFHAEEE